ncbi:class I SAM-dependent methyltransferase [Desulfoferula mesophila]|uniref:class I SAM-dependent methyltransferase n=1 Tax=Desulfoferula mesophila TaxID=3058419 RepID=UPI0030CF2701
MPGEHVCPWWVIRTFDNPLRRVFHQPEKMLGPYVGEGGRAADIGCGIGFFTLGLARLVGDSGRVYALDLQRKMLDGVERRAAKAGLSGRIETRQVAADDLRSQDMAGSLDLALAFWMLHEVPDQGRFLRQTRELLKPNGRCFLVEPRMHVTQGNFEQSLLLASEFGLKIEQRPRVSLSRAAVLTLR